MSFPTTPILSPLTGSNEDPLSEGGAFLGEIQNDLVFIDRLRRQDNAAASTTAVGTIVSQAYWASSFGADQESYGTITIKPDEDTFKWSVWLRIQNPGGASAVGYVIDAVVQAGTDTFEVFRLSAGSTYTQVVSGSLSTMTQEYASGDSFGASIIGNTITVYYKAAAGAWTQLGQGTDDNISGPGFIGLHTSGQTTPWRFNDFGGGDVGGSAADDPPIGFLGRGAGW